MRPQRLLFIFAVLIAQQREAFAFPWLTPDSRTIALHLEQTNRWEEALDAWLQIYTSDRRNEETQTHVRKCVRAVLRTQRQREGVPRSGIAALPAGQAIQLYGETLQTLRTLYLDSAKTTPTRLFREGLAEFLATLQDPAFRAEYLPEAKAETVRQFIGHAKLTWGTAEIATPLRAREMVLDVAVSARRDLGLPRTSIVIAEFLYGACNGLDEYSAYLPPTNGLPESSEAPSVTNAQLLKDGIGYVAVTSFRATTRNELLAAIDQFRMTSDAMQPFRGMIVDLRGNPGGSLMGAIHAASVFLPEGVIVSLQSPRKELSKIHAADAMQTVDVPLVILTDADTASSAEVFAGALRDHQRATLIGVATFGKGTAQQVVPLSGERPENGSLRVTFARLVGPNGQSWQGNGVVPNIHEPDRQRQLELAVQHLSRMGMR